MFPFKGRLTTAMYSLLKRCFGPVHFSQVVISSQTDHVAGGPPHRAEHWALKPTSTRAVNNRCHAVDTWQVATQHCTG